MSKLPLPLIQVDILGPYAEHNMPCTVCRIEHAVLDLNCGLMQPCWTCQELGYRVIKLSKFGRFQKFLNKGLK